MSDVIKQFLKAYFCGDHQSRCAALRCPVDVSIAVFEQQLYHFRVTVLPRSQSSLISHTFIDVSYQPRTLAASKSGNESGLLLSLAVAPRASSKRTTSIAPHCTIAVFQTTWR